MVISYRTAMTPLLPSLATQLAHGFETSRQGCFLWATDSILREFSEGAEFVDQATATAIYQFFEQQALSFLRILNDLPPEDLPDGTCFPVPIAGGPAVFTFKSNTSPLTQSSKISSASRSTR